LSFRELARRHGVHRWAVRRYVREACHELDLDHRDVAIVAHHLPGVEAQVDFGLA